MFVQCNIVLENVSCVIVVGFLCVSPISQNVKLGLLMPSTNGNCSLFKYRNSINENGVVALKDPNDAQSCESFIFHNKNIDITVNLNNV